MFPSERSRGAFILAVLGAAIVSASFFAPWLSYDYSSGRRTPEGGYHDPNDTGLIRHEIDFGTNSIDGNAPPTDPDGADRLVLLIAIGAAVGVAGFAIMAIGELPFVHRFVPRGVSLACCIASILGVTFAMVVTWVYLPNTLSGYGIRGPFHYEQLDPGYIRTTLNLGWFAVFCSTPFALGAFAFKFQAGSTDPTIIERFRTEGVKGEIPVKP